MNRPIINSVMLCAFLTGCISQQTLQPVSLPAVTKVQAEIKRQIGIYMSAAQNPPTILINGKKLSIANEYFKNDFWCGSGKINFDISSIKVELTTTTDNLTDLQAGLSIPVAAVTLGGSGERKKDVNNIQVLDYNLWPLPISNQNHEVMEQPIDQAILDKTPIAKALLQLRDGLIFSSMKHDYSGPTAIERPPQPCFLDYNPDKPGSDAGDSFKIGLSITSDSTSGFSVNVGILKFSNTDDIKSTTGNSMVVSFVQDGLAALQAAKDEVDSVCKLPNENYAKCLKAKYKMNKIDLGVGILELSGEKTM